MKRSPRPRRTSELSKSLHRQLAMYALAASATGVEVLALAQPSEAKIIYTKTHRVIGANGIYPLDLNHDGTIDFLIEETAQTGQTCGASWSNRLGVKGAFGNPVMGSNFLAAALKKGAPIGAAQGFISNTTSRGEAMVVLGCSELGCTTHGEWVNVTGRYLGLRFQISGKAHYGWARLSVQVQGCQVLRATLTGYAYETVPNKGIHAGQTHGANDAPRLDSAAVPLVSRPVQPASLGQLAFGARTPSAWRRP